jgi:hypothetical protein
MDHCCKDRQAPEPAAKADEKGCCAECPDQGCDGCDCAKPQNTTGGCMGGGCGCQNR